jgi:hypothetical protein
MKRRWWLAPLLVIAMAACTPSDGGDAPTSEPSVTEGEETEEPTTAPGVIDY